MNVSEPKNEIKIRAEHVDFSYENTQTLFDINLEFRNHEVTALIGPSGCGKSTFLRTLSRMNELICDTTLKGKILLDGEDIYAPNYDVVQLRQRVGMVFQKPTPFPKSIFENVAYGLRVAGISSRSILAEKVEESLRRAALWEEVKDRLNESALGLSGGQQQRLCIARALLKKPKILILDDSTSAVDTRTDAMIRQAFREEIPGTTKLIIAQRISSVQDADRIIVMEGGRIKDIGNHDELLKTSEIYRETFTSQNKMSAEGEDAGETAAAGTEASASQAQTQEGGEAHE